MKGAINWRRLAMGLATLLSARPQGFFIPYRHAAGLPAPGTLPAYGSLSAIFESRRKAFLDLIIYFNKIKYNLDNIDNILENEPHYPRWDQVWFPRLDAAAAYALVLREQPERIVEIGSGHSTRFLMRAIRDGGLATQFTSVDPEPRAVVDGLDIQVHRQTLHAVAVDIFSDLAPGDFLFVDSSHILMPGSDVDQILNRILPALPAGVFIHFHDIFLPWDYPAEWAWRGYNEQQGVAALIQGGIYEIIFSSRYTITEMQESLNASPLAAIPLPNGAFENSLWLKKTG